jgi:hypothetical protein
LNLLDQASKARFPNSKILLEGTIGRSDQCHDGCLCLEQEKVDELLPAGNKIASYN